jgi:nitrite reductase/ring-hydroxylating ferredoxin subunit/uncharacterized membrane protein
MQSRASIHGHPLHPALVSYPFALLTTAFGFAATAMVSRNRELSVVSRYLVPPGIAAGLLAAGAGIIDYVYSVPPESSAKERATNHGLLNATALGLFAASWLLGRSRRGRALPLALQGAGTAVMSVAGWMGGTLVFRNQIGVDHRYANAGKWREASLPHPGEGALVGATGQLDVNQMTLVHAGNDRIVVARTERGHVAFGDRCTHRGGPLSDGVLICGTVQCPWHGSQFDVQTGEVKCGPAEKAIPTYPMA